MPKNMNTTSKVAGLRRRDFLKTLGLVSGGMLVAGASAVPAATRRTAVRIGVLIPRSTLYPSLGDSFVAGLKLAFTNSDPVDWVVEDVGFTPGWVLEKCRRLVEVIKVDVVVAAVNAEMEGQLAPLIEKAGVPLILCPVGARVHQPRIANPQGIINSLNYWQSCCAMGSWAAEHLGRKAMIALSMHESGYDAHYAFRLGFEASGGSILASRVTDAPYYPGGPAAFMTEAKALESDLIFACYSGHQGLAFLRTYRASEMANTVPLAASAFLVDDSMLAPLGEDAHGIRSCFSWAASLPTAANETFVRAYRERTRNMPDIFSMHGYETGLLVAGALDAGGVRGLRGALQRAAFESPRGRWEVDSQTGCSRTPHYLREVERQRGMETNHVVGELPPADESHDQVTALQAGTRSGWINTYLCT